MDTHSQTHHNGTQAASETEVTARPKRRIDWVLKTPELAVTEFRVINHDVTDHLAVAAELTWK